MRDVCGLRFQRPGLDRRSVDLLAGLEDLVWYVVRSGQLVDDLIDAADDLDRGNHTWVVRRLGGNGGRAALLNRMGIGGGFDEIIADIKKDLGSADDAAVRLEAHSVSPG